MMRRKPPVRKAPAVGIFDKRGVTPKVSVAFDIDLFEAIADTAASRQVSFGQIVRELCRAALQRDRGDGR